jgi:hypothetical protein
MPDEAYWDPDNEAVWQEKVPGEDRAITLRHPAYPYPGLWATTDPDDLTNIAAAYLRKVGGKFGLRPDLLEVSGSRFKVPPLSEIPLTWLPLGSEANRRVPLASVWLRRYLHLPAPEGTSPVLSDRTAVFLAVQSGAVNDPTMALGSRLGIRIVAHVSASGEVRITGSTCSSELVESSGPHVERTLPFLTSFFSQGQGADSFRADLRRAIREAAGLTRDEDLFLDGLRIRSPKRREPSFIEVYANVPRPADDPSAFAYALTMKVTTFLPPFQLEVAGKVPLVAHASPVKPHLFLRDPDSQTGPDHVVDARANRSPQKLENFRHQKTLPGLSLDASGNATLVDDLAQVEVTQSKLVDKNANESLPVVVADPANAANVRDARTNPFAALSGYWHGRELFDTMRSYGLEPIDYFRLVEFPLLVRYRATITPGPGKDGKTVNAQVDYDPPGSQLWDDPQVPKPVQVRFALADLKRSASRRQPLGLAADPRLSWHEFGHVLLAASTGALEFRFAHSAGDALAAIRWDPLSDVVSEPPYIPPQFPPPLDNPERPPYTRLRMATFPWVYLNRRHDRSVYSGWSWCGTYHRPLRFGPETARRRKGYQSEQILSTSLFRLYRALGGDAVDNAGKPDRAARQFASDYTVYLIMRAIAWLGPVSLVPAETPDQFVSALIDADVGSNSVLWAGPAPLGRVGGCAHKVIRWAFEAQGLDATADPEAIVDMPGKPPAIDVFIDNGRPDSEGSHPLGGYMPVSLDWHVSPNPSRWHATDTAVKITNADVRVTVGNRGSLQATGVVVRVSYIKWVAGQPPPPWDRTKWTALAPSASQNIPPGTAVQFLPFTGMPTQRGRYLFLAEATCPADPANTDSLTPLLPLSCSINPTPVVDLVAGDNNLGLRVYRVP